MVAVYKVLEDSEGTIVLEITIVVTVLTFIAVMDLVTKVYGKKRRP